MVSEAYAQLAEKSPIHCTLDDLLEEVKALGRLQWRGDVALLPRSALCGTSWQLLVERWHEKHLNSLWEAMRSRIGARMLMRQGEILVDDEVRGGAVEVLAGSG